MGIVHDQSPMEFFREQLEKAMEHQRVSTSAFTEHYLVSLLTAGVQPERAQAPVPVVDETPLALLYVRALQSSRAERARLLRALGDTALFYSGFFADRLTRRLNDLSYYRSLGGYAYAHLSRTDDPFGYTPEVYSELADRFLTFADLLAEVSETTRLTTPASIVQLYERWLQTRSRRAAVLLQEQGIAPLAPGSDAIQ